MKYKVLLCGRGQNQNMVSDFLQYTVAFFETLTTSELANDIRAHFRFFQPRVYLMFVESGIDQVIEHIKSLRESDYYNGAYIVLVGDGDACNTIERRESRLADLVIRRPITTDNLALRITGYIEEASAGRARNANAVEAAAPAPASARPSQPAPRPKPASISEKADQMDAQMDALIRAAEAAVNEATASAIASGASPVLLGRRHVLVVDDDRTVLKMLKTALEETYDVTTMAGGAMVEKLLASKRVDLIILDYEMPVETGAEVFQRLKKNPKAANIPVCFLTGVSDREKIMEVMSLRPSGYVLKPIDMDMLKSTIRNIIG